MKTKVPERAERHQVRVAFDAQDTQTLRELRVRLQSENIDRVITDAETIRAAVRHMKECTS